MILGNGYFGSSTFVPCPPFPMMIAEVLMSSFITHAMRYTPPMPSITVEGVEGFPALKMTWQGHVTTADVAIAFRRVADALDSADQPMYVIVDLLSNPQFPTMNAVHETLPSLQNTRLKQWLVVGSSWMAKSLEGAIA